MRTRVLITVTAYPLPSRSHDELVCTAGVMEDGTWVRIYPVPFRFLEYHKWEWVELDLIPHDPGHDFRPESRRPKSYELNDLQIRGKVGTEQAWLIRKELCLRNAYTNLSALIADSGAPMNRSLAAFTPTKIVRFIVEDDDREWKPEWLEQLKQMDLLTRPEGVQQRTVIDKIPYKFKYQFVDDEGRESTMTIEDWEIGALYRNCLAAAEGDEEVALEKVRLKYEAEFLRDKEISLFLGTTLKHHRARHTNPFTIVGVFYPPRSLQGQLL